MAFHNMFLPKEWLLSPRAQRVYFFAAVLSILFIVTIFVIAFTESWMGKPAYESSTLAFLLSRVVLISIVGLALLEVGMLYYWYGYDNSHWMIKALCFLLFLIPPFGGIVYYFAVYRRGIRKLGMEEQDNSQNYSATA